MEKTYWIGRKRSAMAMALHAETAEARLIHYDLAGRYSIKAAQCLPFAQPDERRAAGGERAMLHLPDLSLLRPPQQPLPHHERGMRRDPDAAIGEVR